MQNNLKTKLKIAGSIIGVIIIVGYAYFEARNLIQGPTITILTPENGISIAAPYVIITGTAEHTSFLTLNDREIFVDTEGRFNQKLLLPEGYTIIELEAKDRFSRTVTEVRELYREPSEEPLETPEIATTSPIVDVATTTEEETLE